MGELLKEEAKTRCDRCATKPRAKDTLTDTSASDTRCGEDTPNARGVAFLGWLLGPLSLGGALQEVSAGDVTGEVFLACRELKE